MNLRLIWAALCDRPIANRISVVDGTLLVTENGSFIRDCFINPISDDYQAFIDDQLNRLLILSEKKRERYVQKQVLSKLLKRRTAAIRVTGGKA